jgi:H+/Na+-translocating ferredoxin:NAD+ oxidoreductase subunit G
MSNKEIMKITMNLVIICVLAGVILSATWALTDPVKVRKEAQEREAALKSLIPQADSIKEVKDIVSSGKEGKIYKATAKSKTIGYVVLAYSKGYSSFITMLVAVDPDYRLIAIQILDHKETPGLGDQIDQDWFKRQFRGKAEENLVVVKGPTDTDIQAISGATISSRGVTRGVKEAVDALRAERAKDPAL